MLKSQISSVMKQAFTTFSSKSEMFYQNVEILKTLLEKTTSDDVNLEPQFLSDTFWKRPKKAPVTYIDIFEHDLFSVGIFILKPGMKLPLHNHPEMYGFLKIILGKVKITSYSLNTAKTKNINFKNVQGKDFHTYLSRKGDMEIAEKVAEEIVDKNCECCTLEPEKKNLHEIECVDGPAAFIDILAPPYETVIPGVGPRECNYYNVLSELAADVFMLERISSPPWYWTDSFAYTGPDITDAITN